jgi:hypothetical protein
MLRWIALIYIIEPMPGSLHAAHTVCSQPPTNVAVFYFVMSNNGAVTQQHHGTFFL